MTKKKSLILILGFIFVLTTLSVFFAIPASAAGASAYDIPAERFAATEFSQLTTGIYWYQSGSDLPIAAKDATNYDPKKPTIIYAHGMKMNHEGLQCREGLSLKDNNKGAMTKKGFDEYAYEPEFYQTLIDQGYNVGVFYWNQLADCYFTEDWKFWATSHWTEIPGKGWVLYNDLTYTYLDEKGKAQETEYDDESNLKCTVAKLYGDSLIEALGEDFSGHLQLVGHSMGGQLTLAVSQALCAAYDRGEISSAYLPDRVTLLDPYLGFTDGCVGISDTTGEELDETAPTSLMAAQAAEMVAAHGIPIEAYGANIAAYYIYGGLKISKLEDNDLILRIRKLFDDNIAWVYLDALMDTYSSFIPTHTMAIDYYFSTMYMDVKTDNGGVEIPSFKASDEHIAQLRGMAFSQGYDTTKEKPNPLYQCDSSYTRIKIVLDTDVEEGEAIKEIHEPVEAPPLPAVIQGTVDDNNTDKKLTVRLTSGKETVMEVPVLKGKFLFTNVEEGDYTVSVYSGNKKVSDAAQVSVTDDDTAVTTEEIQIKSTSKTTGSTGSDKPNTLLYVGIGAGALVVLILLIVIIKKRR